VEGKRSRSRQEVTSLSSGRRKTRLGEFGRRDSERRMQEALRKAAERFGRRTIGTLQNTRRICASDVNRSVSRTALLGRGRQLLGFGPLSAVCGEHLQEFLVLKSELMVCFVGIQPYLGSSCLSPKGKSSKLEILFIRVDFQAQGFDLRRLERAD
jgi:hypothetical protein